ncbi:MAG: hypothetical protein E7560_03145 [Ruminococcaceae bacterium]|nr:hypothetical protein [Oscillospiraceae bacterium]
MIIVNNVSLPLETDFSNLKPIIAKTLKTNADNISEVKLYRKSVDARKKENVHFCCSVLVDLKSNQEKILKKNKNAHIFTEKSYVWKKACKKSENKPIVIGFGPAGMFAALALAKARLNPLVLERGSQIEKRCADVEGFLNGEPLNCESNIQFGEGGAGTFSDGKLNTGIKNERCRTVLEVFSFHGAPQKILTDAKPHIGTDILKTVVKNIRKEIISLGGEVCFDTKLEKVIINNGRIEAVVANGKQISCDELIIATGHSARDTYKMLLESGLEMQKKPFAMGVRVEHLQENINKALYGDFANSEYLSAADYKLASHLENGRGVFTFCMCPGGEVVNASSEDGGIAVNGMSNSKRDGKNANSALLVNISPEDFPSGNVLAGCELQRKIEKKAYEICGGAVPVTTVGSFVFGEKAQIGKVVPTVRPRFELADFGDIFPSFIVESLKEGIKLFDKKIEGFAQREAVLTAPETRSSAPVRIMRNADMQSTLVKGIYPCGEGAGYAGGIMSAAVDGICVAEKIIERYI